MFFAFLACFIFSPRLIFRFSFLGSYHFGAFKCAIVVGSGAAHHFAGETDERQKIAAPVRPVDRHGAGFEMRRLLGAYLRVGAELAGCIEDRGSFLFVDPCFFAANAAVKFTGSSSL